MSGAIPYIINIVISLFVSFVVGSILAPSLPMQARKFEGLKSQIKSNIQARKIIYGETITGGVLINIGAKGKILELIIAVAAHPVEDILGVYLNDEYNNIHPPNSIYLPDVS